MTTPKLGYLCLGENPTAEDGRALIRQFVLVREADRMGYDDIWIGEQHDDRAWPMGASTALLGHLAGVTSKARIGSMPLLPALRNPVALAEDVATLRHAAAQGWGLLAAATHTRERVQRAVSLYTQASGGRAPALVLARFACTAATHDEALAIAQPYIEAFAERARGVGGSAGWGYDRQRSLARDVPALLSESLVGSHAEVARHFKALADDYGATRVAIVPTCAQFDTHKHILADFVDEVRPLLED